jgi:hypothetical protein
VTELKRFIERCLVSENPCDHVHITWLFFRERLKDGYEKIVRHLLELVSPVVAVLSSCEKRTAQGILSTKIFIRELSSEAKVPIAEISDTRNSTSWIPPKCASGHNNIVVDMECSTCLDGHGTDSARGHYRGDNQPCGYLVEVAIGFMQGAYRMTFEAARRAKAVRRWRLLEMECARRREEAASDRVCTTVSLRCGVYGRRHIHDSLVLVMASSAEEAIAVIR